MSGYNRTGFSTSVKLQPLSGDTWSHDASESAQELLHEGSCDVATCDVQHQATASQLGSTMVSASMLDEGEPSCGEVDVDELVKKALAATLLHSNRGCQKGLWCSRWGRVIQHSNKQYVLPGGSFGWKYVDLQPKKFNNSLLRTSPPNMSLFSVL